MAQALYRKYRSKSLDAIVGQEQVTDVLKQAIAASRINHAFLLTGPRGVGKTSIARILAHNINNLTYEDGVNHLDIVEIDAASNRRIDDIRDLREKVNIAPTSAQYKVYIIDEVHMLTGESFNALLKTLEEPPNYVVFILATTEPHKLPATIISRTQRFHLKPISSQNLVEHLGHIAKEEKIKLDKEALKLISTYSDGSFRDGINLLDQLATLAGGKEITTNLVEVTLGLAPHTAVENLLEAIDKRNPKQVIDLLNNLENDGVSPAVLVNQLLLVLRRQAAEKPHRLELIDQLLEVPRAYQPRLKLLTVLTLASAPIKHEATLSAPPVSLELSVEKLPTKPVPKEITKLEDKPKPISKTTKADNLPDKIDWPKLIEKIKAHNAPLYSVLNKADASYSGRELSLHFTYSLHRKKVDSSKYRSALAEIISQTYGSCPPIVMTSGPKPPKNPLAGQVAAIMGGGEEVNVSES